MHTHAMSKSQTYAGIYSVPAYVTVDSALVDDVMWYTIDCTRDVAQWISAQNSELYYSHTPPVYAKVYGNKFDLHSSLYLMLGLAWT